MSLTLSSVDFFVLVLCTLPYPCVRGVSSSTYCSSMNMNMTRVAEGMTYSNQYG